VVLPAASPAGSAARTHIVVDRGKVVRRPLVTTGVIAIPLLGVAAYFVYGRGFVNADIMWALSWGDELAQLRQPSFTAAGTPTPHPLVNFATALLSPLGQGAERAWHVIGYLSIGALLYATWSLGTTLFGRWAGLLAAALVATRATVVFYGPLAYLDLPYTALLIWALVLEARRPRRGTPVLVILAIAGLLRPEAWILAGLYWLWLLPAVDRATAWRALMLVAVAPVLWALADLVATGDPMFSFTHTTHGSVEARPHGVFDLITQGPRLLGQEARPAVVAIAAVGYLLALRHSVHGWRLVAWTTATAVAFSVPVAAGTIANGRYLLPTVVLLCVTAAACITGWSTLFGRARNVWQLCAIVGAIVLLVTIPAQVSRLGGVRDTVVTYRANREGFRRVVTREVPCLPLTFANHRPFPMVVFWTGIDPHELRARGTILGDVVADAPPTGSFLWGTLEAMTGVAYLPSDPTRPVAPPSRTQTVRRQSGWTLRARCS
jgi:hypothetical protein